MSGKKKYNLDLEVQGKAIVYTVPNGTGTVLTYNPTTKEISTRTNAELISDMSLITTNTVQHITNRKFFDTYGSNWGDNSLIVYAASPVNPAMTFYKEGVGIGQIMFDGSQFNLKNSDSSGYQHIRTEGFIKSGSDNSYVLLGGGDHKQVSDFVDRTSGQDITGYKSFFSYLGGDVANNRLWVRSTDGSNPGISFIKEGTDNAQIVYNGAGFLFFNTNSSGYVPVVANGFVKNGSDDNYVLLGGGGHKPVSEFVAPYQLDNYWKIYDTDPYKGFNSDKPFSFFNGNDAQRIYSGGLLVSGFYGDSINIPQYGAFIRGLISTANDGNSAQWKQAYTWGNHADAGYVKKTGDTMTGGLSVPNINLTANVSGISSSQFAGNQIILTGATTMYVGNTQVENYYLESGNVDLYHSRAGVGLGKIWDQHNLNPVTLDTNQTIIGSKIFAQTANVAFYGNEYNNIEIYKNSVNAGIGGVVSGHVLSWYNTRWKVGNARSGDVTSEGYAFWFSSDEGLNYTQKVIIGTDGNIQTNQYGDSAQWNQAYNLAINAVKKSGDTMTGGLRAPNIYSNNFITDEDNTMLRIGNNGDIGIVKKANYQGFFAVGEQGFIVKKTTTSSGPFTVNSSFTDLFSANASGAFVNGNQLWDSLNLPNPATQTQLNNYIPLSGTNNFTGILRSPNNRVQFGNDSGGLGSYILLSEYDNTNYPGSSFYMGGNIEEGFNVSSSNGNNQSSNLYAYWAGVFMSASDTSGSASFNVTPSGCYGDYKAPTIDGSFIQNKWLIENYVNLTGAQTIAGGKQFNAPIVAAAGIVNPGSSNVEVFIGDGSIATMSFEISNEGSQIRLRPGEYDVPSSGFLEISDPTRIIRIFGEESNQTVNLKDVFPRQEYTIYNSDPSGNTMNVQINGTGVGGVNAGFFITIYIRDNLSHVIHARSQFFT